MKYFKEIYFLLGNDKKKLPFLLLLFIIVAMLDGIGISLIVPYVSIIVDQESINQKYIQYLINNFNLPSNQEDLTILASYLLILMFVFKAIGSVFIAYIIEKFSNNIQLRLRKLLMKSYQDLPYTDYLKRNSADYIVSISNLTTHYTKRVVLPLLQALSNCILGMVIIITLAIIDYKILTLVCSTFLIIAYGYDFLFKKSLGIIGAKLNKNSSKMIQAIHEGIEGLKEVRILGIENYFYGTMSNSSRIIADCNTRSAVIAIAPRHIIELVVIVLIASAILYTTASGTNMSAIVPIMAAFSVAALRVLPIITTIISSTNSLRKNRNSVSRLYKDLNELNKFKNVENIIKKSKNKNSNTFSSLILKEVNFAYPDATKDSLIDISMKINAGESIGIIGPSGSGKTSLIDIMLFLLEPSRGEIFFNGVLMNDAVHEWRKQVAYLPQQVFLIDSTLQQNIALGVNHKDVDRQLIDEVVIQSRLSELVDQLPDGINTMIGERGVRISGGQRQRVALARALYHGRDVLIMDESTSALDNETEREIIKEIELLKGSKTMIIIAHRLSTLQHCDRIYRLKDGRLHEEGTYRNFIASSN
jgi:ATP-binding cassette, subfamily B, bacterial PglK